jgi:hypothetical protein
MHSISRASMTKFMRLSCNWDISSVMSHYKNYNKISLLCVGDQLNFIITHFSLHRLQQRSAHATIINLVNIFFPPPPPCSVEVAVSVDLLRVNFHCFSLFFPHSFSIMHVNKQSHKIKLYQAQQKNNIQCKAHQLWTFNETSFCHRLIFIPHNLLLNAAQQSQRAIKQFQNDISFFNNSILMVVHKLMQMRVK